MHLIRSAHNVPVVIKLDINRAFYSVNWMVLRTMFENLHIPDKLIKIFFSGYQNAKIRVQHADGIDNGFILQHGVKKGGPESPTVFSLFIDPVIRKLGNLVAYADDVNLIDMPENVKVRIQQAKQLFGKIGLSVSESKTEIWNERTSHGSREKRPYSKKILKMN